MNSKNQSFPKFKLSEIFVSRLLKKSNFSEVKGMLKNSKSVKLRVIRRASSSRKSFSTNVMQTNILLRNSFPWLGFCTRIRQKLFFPVTKFASVTFHLARIFSLKGSIKKILSSEESYKIVQRMNVFFSNMV